MRMLDNVIDINYYAVDKARNSNLRHRPVGMGICGFPGLPADDARALRLAAVEFADTSMEAVCYHAYWASSLLAEERGRYQSYEGSLWSRGILPQDTLKMLRDERGGHVEVDESSTLDWDTCARASNNMACATPIASHCPNRHYFQYHWRICVHRTHFPELVRQIESLRRVHGRKRLPRA